MVPLTDDHPPEMVTAENSKKYAIGAIGETVRKDGDKIAASLVIFDASVIAKLEAGKCQLSCGYEADIEESPGEINGQKYDSIQRNIRGNHVALVHTGRAGSDVRIRMDAAIMIPESVLETETHTDSIKEFTMEELKEALAKVAKLEVEFAAEKSRADKAEAERDSKASEIEALKADVQKEQNARQDSENSIGDRVRARVNLETKALGVLGKEIELDKLSDREIKLAVVKKLDNVEVPAEKSEDYVNARFDASIERAGKSDEALASARVDAEAGRNTAADAEKQAHEKMVERNRNAWKGSK